MRLVWQFLAVAAVAFVGGQATQALQANAWLTLVFGLTTAVLTVPVYRWVVARTERRAVTELARTGSVSATGLGTLIGVALFGSVIVNIAFLGYYEVDGLGSVTGAVGLLGFMAAAAVTEEVLFRGVLFRIVEERIGSWIAMVLTGVLFGVMHLPNPNATVWGALAIGIAAGGMLTGAYVATRSLWLPIGLHFGWNFAASAIFSTEVSGNNTPQGILDTSMSGPLLITGGKFGPEGSVYAILFCTLATVVFLWIAHRRGRLVPRRRRAARAGRPEATADVPQ